MIFLVISASSFEKAKKLILNLMLRTWFLKIAQCFRALAFFWFLLRGFASEFSASLLLSSSSFLLDLMHNLRKFMKKYIIKLTLLSIYLNPSLESSQPVLFDDGGDAKAFGQCHHFCRCSPSFISWCELCSIRPRINSDH